VSLLLVCVQCTVQSETDMFCLQLRVFCETVNIFCTVYSAV